MASRSSRKSGSSGSSKRVQTRHAPVRSGSPRAARSSARSSASARTAAPSVRASSRSSRSVSTRASASVGTRKGGTRRQGSISASFADMAAGVPAAQVGGTTRTVGDIRKAARRERRASAAQRVAKAGRIPLIVIGIIVAVIMVAVIALAIISNTGAFRIQNVDVVGADHLTDEEVSALVSIPEGATLLNVDAEGIESSLIRDSWVESVDVTRIFPDTLQIKVNERPVGAIAEVPIGTNQTIQRWALAEDGMWLMAIPDKTSELGQKLSSQIYDDADAALHIKGIPYGVEPKIGAYCTDASVLNALSIINGLTTDLADSVKTVTATDEESTLLTLENNVEIAFGTADNVREKERICNQIMEENPSVVYINVRVPDRPTWRAA